MSWFGTSRSQPPKERERFYLLPGMGGRAYRRKYRLILKWAVVAGLLTSASVAALLYFLSRPRV